MNARTKLALTLFSTIILTSCDYYNDTRVCNQTGQDITLIIRFDTDGIKNGGLEPRKFTKTFHNWRENLTPIHFDTINFISTYLINRDSCGQIEGGPNRRPNFRFIKAMTVVTKSDTIELKTKGEMRKAFGADREEPEYYFDLLIK
ncbi:hypothetical protein D4L85_23325 [Chryseolinea soli]|uniref:Lipoprotein n=1 Tax=Chryseolinea soli TaxID=2321403 RepID=A0A385SRV1_9BACT|nr:hypothetical protein D4L85_23325 [Chryseolinea soli]